MSIPPAASKLPSVPPLDWRSYLAFFGERSVLYQLQRKRFEHDLLLALGVNEHPQRAWFVYLAWELARVCREDTDLFCSVAQLRRVAAAASELAVLVAP